VLNRILQLGASIFVASTVGWLGWFKTEHLRSAVAPTWPGFALMAVSVATLPVAFAKIFRESDARSRRNWAILVGLCIVLVLVTKLVTGR
jgi:hypothetical protein